MHHVLKEPDLPNVLFIVEGYTYPYDSDEYTFVLSMKNDSKDGSTSDMFQLSMEIQDRLYDKKETFYPLERKPYEGFKSNYVGVLYDQSDKVLISLPKYTQKFIDLENPENAISKEKAMTIAKKYWEDLNYLMGRFNSQLIQRDPLFDACTSVDHNEFALVRALFAWYAEYGLYSQSQPELSNTVGRTLWGLTVNKKHADIINNIPTYRQVIKKRYVSRQDSITQLQMTVLNYLYTERGYCKNFQYISNRPSFQTFASDEIDLNIAEILQDENKKQYWINKIQDAMQMNFRDDHHQLFELLIKFLKAEYSSNMQAQGLYGICRFDNLFEVILSEYFDNQFFAGPSSTKQAINSLSSKFIKDIDGGKILDINQEYYDMANHTISTKEKGSVKTYTYNKHKRYGNTGLLVPDIIFEISYNDKQYVVLIDAKYYNYDIKEEIMQVERFPENYDVTKQYYYAKMLEAIYKKHNVNVEIINMFIMPWHKDYKEDEDEKKEIKKTNPRWLNVGTIEFEGHNMLVFMSSFDAIVQEIKNRTEDSKTHQMRLLKAIKFHHNID